MRLPAPHPPAPSPQGGGGEREHASVALAIEDHYRPLGPNDRVPSDPIAITLALADKLDTLVGFWAFDEKPTGSSDPYALRRAALGLVRIVLYNNIRFAQPSPPLRGRGQGEEGRADAPAPDVLARPSPPTPSPQGGGGQTCGIGFYLRSASCYDSEVCRAAGFNCAISVFGTKSSAFPSFPIRR